MNRQRAIQVMDKYELDGLVATTPANFVYLTDFLMGLAPRSNWHARYWAVLPREPNAEVGVIVPRRSLLYAAQTELPVSDLRGYGKYGYVIPEGAELDPVEQRLIAIRERSREEPNAFNYLMEVLEERGLTGRVTLGIDEMMLNHNDWEELRRRLPEARLVDAHDIFRHIRAVKAPEEIERLRFCLERTNQARLETMKIIRPGVPHREVWQKLETALFEAGVTPRNVCIGIGPSSSFSPTLPLDRVTQRGDLVKFDHGAIYRGYVSDSARTGTVGPPNDKQRRYYDAVLAGEQAACSAVKPGVRACDLHQLIVDTARRRGIPEFGRASLGHGLGLETYDPPLIEAKDTTVLEPGMVMNLEAPHYELGFGGVTVEDAIVVTETGFEYLLDFDRELFVVGD